MYLTISSRKYLAKQGDHGGWYYTDEYGRKHYLSSLTNTQKLDNASVMNLIRNDHYFEKGYRPVTKSKVKEPAMEGEFLTRKGYKQVRQKQPVTKEPVKQSPPVEISKEKLPKEGGSLVAYERTTNDIRAVFEGIKKLPTTTLDETKTVGKQLARFEAGPWQEWLNQWNMLSSEDRASVATEKQNLEVEVENYENEIGKIMARQQANEYPNIKTVRNVEEYNQALESAAFRPIIVKWNGDTCATCRSDIPAWKKMAKENPGTLFLQIEQADEPQWKLLAEKQNVKTLPHFTLLRPSANHPIQATTRSVSELTIPVNEPLPDPSIAEKKNWDLELQAHKNRFASAKQKFNQIKSLPIPRIEAAKVTEQALEKFVNQEWKALADEWFRISNDAANKDQKLDIQLALDMQTFKSDIDNFRTQIDDRKRDLASKAQEEKKKEVPAGPAPTKIIPPLVEDDGYKWTELPSDIGVLRPIPGDIQDRLVPFLEKMSLQADLAKNVCYIGNMEFEYTKIGSRIFPNWESWSQNIYPMLRAQCEKTNKTQFFTLKLREEKTEPFSYVTVALDKTEGGKGYVFFSPTDLPEILHSTFSTPNFANDLFKLLSLQDKEDMSYNTLLVPEFCKREFSSSSPVWCSILHTAMFHLYLLNPGREMYQVQDHFKRQCIDAGNCGYLKQYANFILQTYDKPAFVNVPLAANRSSAALADWKKVKYYLEYIALKADQNAAKRKDKSGVCLYSPSAVLDTSVRVYNPKAVESRSGD